MHIQPLEKIAILGANGSGKSTMLKVMAGYHHFDKGILHWLDDGNKIASPSFSFSAPYLDIFEQLTLSEHIDFHFNQKSTYQNMSKNEILEIGQFEKFKTKQIRELSSGIKQRFKNTLAIFSDSEVLLMDEPCSNLDEENVKLYQALMLEYSKDRIVIIASNSKDEYSFICSKEFEISEMKLNLRGNKQLWA